MGPARLNDLALPEAPLSDLRALTRLTAEPEAARALGVDLAQGRSCTGSLAASVGLDASAWAARLRMHTVPLLATFAVALLATLWPTAAATPIRQWTGSHPRKMQSFGLKRTSEPA